MRTFYLSNDRNQLEAYIALMPFYQGIAIDNACKSFQEAWISLQHYGRENALLSMNKTFAKQANDLERLFMVMMRHLSHLFLKQCIQPLYCIQLRPAHIHPNTLTTSPTFGVNRQDKSPLVEALFQVLGAGVQLPGVKDIIQNACNKVSEKVIPYDQFLQVIEEKKSFIGDKIYQEVLELFDTRKTDIETHTPDEIELRDGVEYYPIHLLVNALDASYIQAHIQPSIFLRLATQSPDQLPLAVQFFLGVINVYLADRYNYAKNIGMVLDENIDMASAFASHVESAMMSGNSVERAIMDFLVDKDIITALTDNDKGAITQQFIAQYNATKTSEYPYEFFLLPQVLPAGYRLQDGQLYIELTHMLDIYRMQGEDVPPHFEAELNQYKERYPFSGATQPLELPVDSCLAAIVAFPEKRYDQIQRYIDNNGDEAIAFRDSFEYSLLTYACQYRAYGIATLLLNKGIVVPTDDLQTIFHHMDPDDIQGIRTLANHLPDKSALLICLFRKAARSPNPSQFNDLIVALLQQVDTRTALLVRDNLVNLKQYTMLTLLLQAGVLDIEHRDQAGCTILMHAIMRSDTLLVKRLIENGANINQVNNAGDSPLYIALNKYMPNALVLALLDKKPQLYMKGKEAMSELDVAIFRGRDKTIIDRLIQNSDDVLGEGCRFSPLLTAAGKQDVSSVQSILQAMKGDKRLSWFVVNTINTLYQNPHWELSEEIAAILVEHIDIDKIDYKGSTALIRACRFQNTPLVQLLIARGADVYLANTRNTIPLAVALNYDVPNELVHALLDAMPTQVPLAREDRIILINKLHGSAHTLSKIQNIKKLANGTRFGNVELYTPLLCIAVMSVLLVLSLVYAPFMVDFVSTAGGSCMLALVILGFSSPLNIYSSETWMMGLELCLLFAGLYSLPTHLSSLSLLPFSIAISALYLLISCSACLLFVDRMEIGKSFPMPLSSPNTLSMTDFLASPIVYLGSILHYPFRFVISIVVTPIAWVSSQIVTPVKATEMASPEPKAFPQNAPSNNNATPRAASPNASNR